MLIALERFECGHQPGVDTEDAGWIVGTAELQVGRYGGRQDSRAQASEIARFLDELVLLDEALTGTAELQLLEGRLHLLVELRGGKGSLDGYLRELDGARLSFTGIEIDQSFLAPVIAHAGTQTTARERRPS